MITSEKIEGVVESLLKVSNELKNPPAATENPFFKSKYCTLDDLITHIKKVTSKHDLFVVQSAELIDANIVVKTRVFHISGQWIETESGVPGGNDAQKTGAAITYARRYALAAMFNVASDPDIDAQDVGEVDKLKEMPQDVRQLFYAKGYRDKNAVKQACEACNYDWNLIRNNLKK